MIETARLSLQQRQIVDRVEHRPQCRPWRAMSWPSNTSRTSSTLATTVICRWAYFTGTL
jgi:hypothetical protein